MVDPHQRSKIEVRVSQPGAADDPAHEQRTATDEKAEIGVVEEQLPEIEDQVDELDQGHDGQGEGYYSESSLLVLIFIYVCSNDVLSDIIAWDASDFKFIKIGVILLLLPHRPHPHPHPIQLLYINILQPDRPNYRLVIQYPLQTLQLVIHLLHTHPHLLPSPLLHRFIVLGCPPLLLDRHPLVPLLPGPHPINLALDPLQIELYAFHFVIDVCDR